MSDALDRATMILARGETTQWLDERDIDHEALRIFAAGCEEGGALLGTTSSAAFQAGFLTALEMTT